MDELNLRNYAYLGDAVWELFIREKTILITGNAKKLHQITTNFVKTSFQSELLEEIDKLLTPQEQELSRMARNLPIPVGRRGIQAEYRRATSFEALIGFWYKNDKARYDVIIDFLENFIKI